MPFLGVDRIEFEKLKTWLVLRSRIRLTFAIASKNILKRNGTLLLAPRLSPDPFHIQGQELYEAVFIMDAYKSPFPMFFNFL